MFSTPSTAQYEVLQGEYSLPVVILSVLIAWVAAYTSLSMNERSHKSSFFHQNLWLVFAAISMGIGVWAMHFVGMSALSLPVHMHYDRLLTFVSIVPAMVASFLALYVSSRSRRTKKTFWIAGLMMGAGISIMHYVGMAAMKMEGVIYSYNVWLWLASVLLAVLVSCVALYVFSMLQHQSERFVVRLIIALILGLAVSSMHFTGMSAITFYVPSDQPLMSGKSHLEEVLFLVKSVSVSIILLLCVFLFSSMLDRYAEHQLRYVDSLTRLPNRRGFERNVAHLPYDALAIWHLHDLESLNRAHGYTFVDELIQTTSLLFTSMKPPLTDLYRLDGHRFAYVARGAKGVQALREAMEKTAERLKQPLLVKERQVKLETVCAFSTSTDKETPAELYSQAMAVLNHPTIEFQHEIIHYNPIVHTQSFAQSLIDDVERAMAENELYVVYQPKVSTSLRRMLGVEALLRWEHPEHGFLSPGVFIPILEKHNRMMDVTDWLIDQVCQQLQAWQTNKKHDWLVAINIPGNYVTSPRLLDCVTNRMEFYGIDPKYLELEITETSFVKKIDEAIEAVNKFREQGLAVALDDFGTGVSSLSYLKKIPITTLKIDKSFIDGVPESEKDAAIIQSIISLGESLKLKVVIEGVETKEQVDYLITTCNAPVIQGYYYSKPLKPEEVPAFFDRCLSLPDVC
ncbi:EAL domain-containing protein [Bacillus sp. REN10]|uniref:bifunctional diguanylate cyclase/phosphodiesterase n=1 Tax=Bacillus sp. REN10 TaxID=2782541 RepID=UPI00193C7A89|nr:EAL domain-containing protein [Bacillus sp. REN10]